MLHNNFGVRQLDHHQITKWANKLSQTAEAGIRATLHATAK